MKDYYFLLNIDKSATEAQIKSAYRKLALKFHPDKNQGDKSAEERFKQIQEAYETLINSEKRFDYDIKFKTTIVETKRDNKYEQEIVKRYGENLKKKEEEIKHKYKTAEQKAEEQNEIKRKENEEKKKQDLEKLEHEKEKQKKVVLQKETGIGNKKKDMDLLRDDIHRLEADIYQHQEVIEKQKKSIAKLEQTIRKTRDEVLKIHSDIVHIEEELLEDKKIIFQLDLKITEVENRDNNADEHTIDYSRAGEMLNGGMIIYTDENGEHGLICSIDDVGKSVWAEVSGLCNNYKAGNHTDWRLPTKDELQMMYSHLYKNKNIKNFAAKNYWSSTINDSDFAWVFDFHSGDAYDFYNKYNAYFVRTVREF